MYRPIFLIVIPLYNHARTIVRVIQGIYAQAGSSGFACHILVVNDGSTDAGEREVATLAVSHSDIPPLTRPALSLITSPTNEGKGAAILRAARWAHEHGFTHMLTMDADDQHRPENIPTLMRRAEEAPNAVIVGARDFSVQNVPASSRFGRAFSGFWMRVQTGLVVDDMQSGLRVYPVSLLLSLKVREKRFAFEMEVLVKAAWANFPVISVPVTVYYPPASERVSHFNKFHDNLRITLMNTRLTIRALLPIPFLERERAEDGQVSVLHPLESLRRLLLRENTPLVLALSTFWAVFITMLPLIGVQSLVTLLAISRFKLNRVWTLALHHAIWPPLLIPLSIEAGYFLRHGSLLTELSWATLGEQAPSRLFEWVLGSLTLGPLVSLLCAALVYLVSWRIREGLNETRRNQAPTP